MSHVVGTVLTVTAIPIGPDSGAPASSPNTWTYNFAHTPASDGTKFLILHFRNATFPAANRLEVDLGDGVRDTFTAADGAEFWTRPININVLPGGLVPVRYITDGAGTGGVEIDKYGRGERHAGDQDPTSLSNCDPFLPGPGDYTEPTYDPFWFCHTPPLWENTACATPDTDVRRRIAQSVGMTVTVHGDHLSTCSVTLIGPDLVITAGHCLGTAGTPEQEALTSSVIFDYQVNCDGSKPGSYTARFHKVKKLLRHRNEYISGIRYDYAVLQLKVPPGGLGLPVVPVRNSLPVAGDQIFGIHHPNGAVKKLSIPHPTFDTVISAASSGIIVDLDVSGGSSGSGLFDTSGRIIGVLSRGFACGLNYCPTATILPDIAAPPGPPITRDVMMVFDRSGSMSMDAGTGRTKIAEARDAASLFVQLIRASTGNRAGLVSFSTTASVPIDFAIATVTPGAKTTLIGPSPYSGGLVGGLMLDGWTSIGGGLEAARLQFPAPGTNPRAILLMTDGLQNTPPMIATVAPLLAGIDMHAIGFGTEASLDGALLTQLAETHNGLYTRAGSGLHLRKFFALAFGNIFEAGALLDPEFTMPKDQRLGTPVPFSVCGEEWITVVVGWDREEATLNVRLKAPSGAGIAAGSAGVEASTGNTWTFLRVPLPYGGERDGTWTVEVMRAGGGGEFPPPAVDVRYFVSVIAAGGPRLTKVPDKRRYYTGEVVNPLVALKYADGSVPQNAVVKVDVTRPTSSAGTILSRTRLRAPLEVNGDVVPARQATLLALRRESGPAIDYGPAEAYELLDDPASTEGTFERSGIFGNPLRDVLVVEGNYTFHVKAGYGVDCIATREVTWSVHVETAVDPSRTLVTSTVGGTRGDGRRDVTITITPRDAYGNYLGPGRLDALPVTGAAGTQATGPVRDNGDGSYSVSAAWDPAVSDRPSVVVGQPGQAPVVLQEPRPRGKDRSSLWRLLFWLLFIIALILLYLLLRR